MRRGVVCIIWSLWVAVVMVAVTGCGGGGSEGGGSSVGDATTNTDSNTALLAPTTIQPVQGGGYLNRVWFKWNSVPGATLYQLDIYDNANDYYNPTFLSGAVCLNGVCDSDLGVGVVLPEGYTRWRVRAGNSSGWGSYSKFIGFIVIPH